MDHQEEKRMNHRIRNVLAALVAGAILAIPAAASIQIAIHEYREYRREVAAAEAEAGGPTPAPEVT